MSETYSDPRSTSSDFLYNSDLYRSEDKGMVTGIHRLPTSSCSAPVQVYRQQREQNKNILLNSLKHPCYWERCKFLTKAHCYYLKLHSACFLSVKLLWEHPFLGNYFCPSHPPFSSHPSHPLAHHGATGWANNFCPPTHSPVKTGIS